MAVEGSSGSVLWTVYTKHELFAVNCNLDITGDGIKDCICGGRMAVSTLFKSGCERILHGYSDTHL